MFRRLILRRTLLIGVPLLLVAAIAWSLFGIWGWFGVLLIGAATMMARGFTILRRARG